MNGYNEYENKDISDLVCELMIRVNSEEMIDQDYVSSVLSGVYDGVVLLEMKCKLLESVVNEINHEVREIEYDDRCS